MGFQEPRIQRLTVETAPGPFSAIHPSAHALGPRRWWAWWHGGVLAVEELALTNVSWPRHSHHSRQPAHEPAFANMMQAHTLTGTFRLTRIPPLEKR